MESREARDATSEAAGELIVLNGLGKYSPGRGERGGGLLGAAVA